MRPGCSVHQPKGGCIGAEELPGVGFKSEDAKRGLGPSGDGSGKIDHRAVPQMHAVEIADGGNGPPVGGVHEIRVSDDTHCGWVA